MSSGSRGPGEDDGDCGLDKVNRGGTYIEWVCALCKDVSESVVPDWNS